MPPDDDVRLRHLIESAEKAISYAAERDRDTLVHDELFRLALTKLVEMIGEAAKQVSAPTRAAHPEVPWSAVARTRDRLVHHYFDINLDVLWSTVTIDLPGLLKVIPRPGPNEADDGAHSP